jgi:hypothetical protein
VTAGGPVCPAVQAASAATPAPQRIVLMYFKSFP